MHLHGPTLKIWQPYSYLAASRLFVHEQQRRGGPVRLSRPPSVSLQERQLSHSLRPADWLSETAAAKASEILDKDARDCLSRLQRCPVYVPRLQRTVQTVWLSTDPASDGQKGAAPVVILPGFDSSCLELRKLLPCLQRAGAYALSVDLAGSGFTDAGFRQDPGGSIGPAEKRAHLYAFWQQEVRQPMVLVGASLGGATAVDFVLNHPEAVSKLILIDGQAWAEGLGPMASLPRWAALLGVQVLRAKQLRRVAGRMAYHDKSMATEDAMLIGRLHTEMPGWPDAVVSFMKSGGYRIASSIKQVQQETLIIWGKNDEILDPKLAEQFAEAIPLCNVSYVEDCGHVGHLEKPDEVAKRILDFIEKSS